MKAAEAKTTFRALWEPEILDTVDRGGEEELLWYWETWIEAQVEDGTLPQSALRWAPPKWLVKLNTKYLLRAK